MKVGKTMFTKIKEEIKNYAEQYNILKKVYMDKNTELKANYIGKMFDSEFATNHQQFNDAVLALQIEAKEKLSTAYSAITESIRNSVIDDLGSETIAELNLIKGLNLSEFEIRGYAEKYTGNAKALRILTEIAESKGIYFNYTSHQEVLDVVKQLKERTTDFINGYHGDYRMFGFYAGDYNHALTLNGDPIDLAEDVYNDFMNPFKGSASNG
ncbi:MAG TPA: hypothetical protein GX401_03265 [Clostridiales bacterium]|nr:hypothetical protein [Clostridiales bacterium]